MDRDWANLPKHLLDSVVETLVLPTHYVRFSLVCKSWYSVAKDNKNKHVRMTAPMLLIYSGKKDYWNLYNIDSNKVLDLQVRVPNKRLCGSSKGWLIFVDRNDVDKNFGVTLVNPFFRVKGRREKANSFIRLTPLMPPGWEKWFKRCEEYVFKATISADPILNPEDCIVMVIHLERLQLAFIRLGKDTTWTYMDERDNIVLGCQMIEEVIKIEDTFHAVSYSNKLYTFDVNSQSYSNVQLVVPENKPIRLIKRYIFEGEGKSLLMVHRYMEYEGDDYKRVTKKFRVFELNSHKGEWVEKSSLGDIALFVGDNSSISVLPSNISGCQSNCIYFNHDCDHIFCLNAPHDFGIYNVVDQIFLETYPAHVKKLMKRSWGLLPIWVIPTLYLQL
ncbi:F-box protein SKIP23-like [Rosa rugosa]|uniref:F-box protein SKIP23-like n=1 Tax=Rosa rugosa TaxID=74645 RepID=UPI002B40D5B2|nr:F-box protein SKIP23-like [Rosa rugosa]